MFKYNNLERKLEEKLTNKKAPNRIEITSIWVLMFSIKHLNLSKFLGMRLQRKERKAVKPTVCSQVTLTKSTKTPHPTPTPTMLVLKLFHGIVT